MNEEFMRLKKWVEKCPVEAAMKIEELKQKLEDQQKTIQSINFWHHHFKELYYTQLDLGHKKSNRMAELEKALKKIVAYSGINKEIDYDLWQLAKKALEERGIVNGEKITKSN